MQKLALKFKETRSEKDFTALYNKSVPYLTNYLYRYKSHKNVDIDEAVGIALTIVWFKIDQYNDEKASYATWATKIAINEHTRIRVREGKKAVAMNTVNALEMSDLLTDHEVEENQYIYLTIDPYLELVDEPYKSMLRDKYVDGMTERDLIIKYNVPLGTVKTNLRRGKKLIRTALQQQGREMEQDSNNVVTANRDETYSLINT